MWTADGTLLRAASTTGRRRNEGLRCVCFRLLLSAVIRSRTGQADFPVGGCLRFSPLQPLQNDRFVIPKSRYDSVDCYISDSPSNRPEYNDNDMPIDEGIRDRLVERGVDPILATHFAHLFIRDPIVIFEETMAQDDEKSSDHFEVRFSPPSFFFLCCSKDGS